MRPISTFSNAMSRAAQLGGLHSAVRTLTTVAIDPSDLLRAQIVLAISALDHLVHELTVAGMLEIYDGIRPSTPAYTKFQIPLSSVHGASAQLSKGAFESAIRERHSYLSFQRPEKIADAIRHFSSVGLWDEVAAGLSEDAASLKMDVNLAVDRRNKIAHEADIDPTYPGQRWPISESDASGVVTLINRVGHQIVTVVA